MVWKVLKNREGKLHHVTFCIGLCPFGRTFFLIKLAQTSGFQCSAMENPKSLCHTTGDLFFPASELLPPDRFSVSSLSRQTMPRVRLQHKHRWDTGVGRCTVRQQDSRGEWRGDRFSRGRLELYLSVGGVGGVWWRNWSCCGYEGKERWKPRHKHKHWLALQWFLFLVFSPPLHQLNINKYNTESLGQLQQMVDWSEGEKNQQNK